MDNRNLNISTRPEGDVTVVAFKGAAHEGAAARFRESFTSLLESGRRRFVLDFGGLRYIDSMLVAETISSFKRAAGHSGSVRVVSARGTQVRQILEITALDRVLEVFDTVDEALSPAAFSAALESA